MLPRLQAEESQLAATRVAVGSGTSKEGTSILRAWEQTAARHRPRAKPSKARAAAMPRELAEMGIGFEFYQPKAGA